MMYNTKKITTIKRLIYLFIPFKFYLSIITLSLIIYTSISLSIPLLNKSLMDNGILARNFNHVVLISCVLFAIYLTNGGNDILKELIRSKIELNLYQSLIGDAYDKLIHVKIDFYYSKNNTEILNDLMLDTKMILGVCDNNVFFVITQLLSFLGGIIGLFIINYKLALLVILFIPIKYFLVNYFGKIRGLYTKKFMQANNIFSHWFGDTLSGIKEIKLFNIKHKKFNEQKEHTSQLAKIGRKITILDAVNSSSDMILMQFLECTLYVCGAYLVFDDSLTIGSLFAFITYSMQVVDPISNVLNIKYILTGILPSAERYFDFIDKSNKDREQEGNEVIFKINTLQFKNVSFSYKNKIIINKINLSLASGEKIALVGNNGSGKSTILNLIQKFILPTSGEILANGENINLFNLEIYRNNLCCINQNNHIFNTSVVNNITLYKDIDINTINFALDKSGVKDFIRSIDNESHLVGQDGCMLSGGQKQKIIFARLLASKASIYLFDEATSNLDYDSEKKIFEFLKEHLKNSISIFVIHKTELLRYMDKIIYLNSDGTSNIFNTYEDFMHKYKSTSIFLHN